MKLPYDFTSLSALVKLATHVNLMLATKYDTLPAISPDDQSMSRFVNRNAMAEVFLNDADERNVFLQAAIKPIHGEGVSAPVEFVPFKTRYTGIFRSGGVGILRLSKATTGEPFTPGLALKILVDEYPSVDFHAMHSLDGQTDPNFFKNTFTTRVAPPKRILLKFIGFFFARSLAVVSRNKTNRPADARTIPLIEAALKNSECSEIPIAPVELRFVPSVTLRSEQASQDFRQQIMDQQFEHGTVIYRVHDESFGMVGDIVLTGDFIASAHGDSMHFKHQRISSVMERDTVCPRWN